MISLFDRALSDLTIVLVVGLSAGTIMSTLAWPLFDRGMAPKINDRSPIVVFAGVVLVTVGLLGLAAAPRVPQLSTIASQTWENAGFTYLLSIGWILPILFGRAADAESWATLGMKWRRCLKYLCLIGSIPIVLIVLIQGDTVASLLALLLAFCGAAAVWRTA